MGVDDSRLTLTNLDKSLDNLSHESLGIERLTAMFEGKFKGILVRHYEEKRFYQLFQKFRLQVKLKLEGVLFCTFTFFIIVFYGRNDEADDRVHKSFHHRLLEPLVKSSD